MRVLKDIFNPTDKAAMQLDPVFQLKNICKAFYERKNAVNEDLVQTLDALSNERPTSLQMKRRHFYVDDTESSHCTQNLEWMRINAEKERILRYKQISQDTASLYYKILDQYSTLLIGKKAKEIDILDKQEANVPVVEQDLQAIVQVTFRETQLHNTLKFICEYIKRVNENGNVFTTGHFFILLLELTAKDIQNRLAPYLKVLVEELKVPRDQYARFLDGLLD